MVSPASRQSYLIPSPNQENSISCLKGMPQTEFDKLPEDAKTQILNNLDVANEYLKMVSWRELSGWTCNVREQLFNHLDRVLELRNKEEVHINSITTLMVYHNVQLTSMLAIDPKELKEMICRPGPEPLSWLFETKIEWNRFINLDKPLRIELLNRYSRVVELITKGVKWDDILSLPFCTLKTLLASSNSIIDWLNSGAKWEEISATPIEVLTKVLEKPLRMTTLLEKVKWNDVVNQEEALRNKILLNSNKIYDWMEEEKLSWEDCLSRIKTT